MRVPGTQYAIHASFSAGEFSSYQFTTTPEDFISAIAESSDSAAVYPGTGTQTASYNDLNQLTDLSGQALGYDANGNLTSDGQRTYSWDAENRLVGIAYPGQPGKATAFTYDGSSRRVAISSTPAGGGSATTTSYIWCGSSLCQARDASNAPVREYFGEGEFVPGSPGQPYYYGIDQLGSVRRAFAGTGNAPAYSYDPYGNALQATAPVTDFGYAGMFYNADSGLYLTQYRAYDPLAGRWLSRDPLGEASDPAGNLYAYVGGNPASHSDPTGLKVYTTVTVSGQGGIGFGAAEGGQTFLLDPCNSQIYGFAYAGLGVGIGFGGTVSVQSGIIDLPSGNPMDLTGWGSSYGAFAAAGVAGIQGSYSHNAYGSNEYNGGSVGYAAGAGAGGAALSTYTWSEGTQSYSSAPDWLRGALDAVGGGSGGCSC